MVDLKITVANANLAKKINRSYTGKFIRDPRRRKPIQRHDKYEKSYGKTALVRRPTNYSVFRISDNVWQTLLVYVAKEPDDRRLL